MDPNLPSAAPILSSAKRQVNKKPFIIFGGVLVLVILAIVIFFSRSFFQIKPSSILPQTISPNILYLTQPVFNFSGTIDQISGDTLIVSGEMISLPTTQITADTPPVSKSTSKKITYKVKVSSNTILNLPPVNVPYSFKVATPSASKITLKDLKVGQRVNVSSKTDLRINASDQFEALSVTVSPGLNTINGTIQNLSGNTLVVKAEPPSVPKEKEYSFTVDPETEIATSIPKVQKLALSDLKKDVQVAVFTVTDINTSQNIKALKIEVFPVSPSIATPSASPKP